MILEVVLVYVLATVSAVWLHERGHYLMARKLGYQARFGVDKKGFYVWHDCTKPRDQYRIVMTGIVLGYVPLLVLLVYSVEVAVLWAIGWTFANLNEFNKANKLEKKAMLEESR